ncbi:hypothetical protein CDD80_2689 [Ophiocordyceps camponoti-rufipedis]|uniref:F-box domain-containing protein n=1 Tax=Ophiocordyceps camponoti-rufipedis TaxID=2004952 RepID=A0A2C5ZLH0_9HYPO|nr:hypothetical protein CDD80_2689 [Ophiocordyceps camponoti-rufipedis]
MEDLEAGRTCFATENYHDALKHFTRTMQDCRCNTKRRRLRCSCKNFYEAIEKDHISILEASLRPCKCIAGGFEKCDDLLHIKALDYRSATFEALDQMDRAEADAIWILELAPSLPHGYLRLGKIARLRKKNWLAGKIYGNGVEATKELSPNKPPEVQELKRKLARIQLRFMTRRDPIVFPLEVFYIIMGNLPITDLVKCLAVSRAWRQSLVKDHGCHLWRELDFRTPPAQPLSVQDINTLVARSGYALKTIVIKDSLLFKLTEAKLNALLRHNKWLEYLHVCLAYTEAQRLPYEPGMYSRLRFLCLDSFRDDSVILRRPNPVTENHLLARTFVTRIASVLEHFVLRGATPPSWCSRIDLPEFPNLKSFRLHRQNEPPHTVPFMEFPIFYLAQKTPRLEQLMLANLDLDYRSIQEDLPDWPHMWPNLKVFVCHRDRANSLQQTRRTFMSVALVNTINWGNNMRCLDLDLLHGNPDHAGEQPAICIIDDLIRRHIVTRDKAPLPPGTNFANLRSLKMSNFSLEPRLMQRVLSDTVARRNLHSLDFVFPLENNMDQRGRKCIEYLVKYDWIRGLDSMRHMGFKRFVFPEVSLREEDAPLSGFLASFPNLESVYLDSEFLTEDEFVSLITRVMRETRIKTIYQLRVHGARMDHLKMLSRSYGVKLCWDNKPRVWPQTMED